MDLTLREQEHHAYMDLVTMRHWAQQVRVLEDHSLQVLNLLMLPNSPAIALTKFICNLEARVFVLIQTALRIEAKEDGLPKKGKTEK